MYTLQTFVRVNWSYIAVLASQLLLSSVFLVATAASTAAAGLQVFKGSSLATMCGLDSDARQELGELRDFGTLEHRAPRMRVRLQRSGTGTALWLRRSDGGWRTPWQAERRDKIGWR